MICFLLFRMPIRKFYTHPRASAERRSGERDISAKGYKITLPRGAGYQAGSWISHGARETLETSGFLPNLFRALSNLIERQGCQRTRTPSEKWPWITARMYAKSGHPNFQVEVMHIRRHCSMSKCVLRSVLNKKAS